jgi:outer membrane lipoprotein-sorting protein
MKLLIKLFFIILFVNYSFTSNSFANEIYKKNQPILNKIANHLNNIKYLQADFLQESFEGDINFGKFYLSRPGKMRIEYDEKIPILIIVNGNILSYIDLELEETSNISTGSTPASFLTRKNISFYDKDIQLLDFKENKKQYHVSLVKKNRKEAGVFHLIFNKNPLHFDEMRVDNDLDQTTSIRFTKTDYKNKIKSDKFIVKNSNLPE